MPRICPLSRPPGCIQVQAATRRLLTGLLCVCSPCSLGFPLQPTCVWFLNAEWRGSSGSQLPLLLQSRVGQTGAPAHTLLRAHWP